MSSPAVSPWTLNAWESFPPLVTTISASAIGVIATATIIGDRRFPAIGAVGLIGAVAMTAVAAASGRWVSAAAGRSPRAP